MLFDIETAVGEARAVHANNTGFFAIFSKHKGPKKTSQVSYRMEQLDEVVSLVKNTPDVYISQASFAYASREKSALKNLGCAFIDIDCYNFGHTADEEFQSLLLDKATCYGIPLPSYIIRSGRGLYLKWIFKKSISASNIYKWEALQNALVSLYQAIGADMAARDVSRVLRVVGSTNSASGGACVETAWNGNRTHDFDDLCNLVANIDLPELNQSTAVKTRKARTAQNLIKKLSNNYSLTAVEQANQNKVAISHLQNFSSQHQPIMLNDMSLLQLNWQRFIDIRDLSIMRGGIRQGGRDLTLFWMGSFLSQSGIITPGNFAKEMTDLSSGFPGADFSPMEDGSMSSLFSRLESHQRGEKVVFNGKSYTRMYTPTNDRLIDIFEITPEEQSKLGTIIDAREKAIRSDAKNPGRADRREQRIEWRFKANELAKKAKTEGVEISVTKIAQEVGVHKTQVSRLLSGKIGLARKPRARIHKKRADSSKSSHNYATIYGVQAALGKGGAPIIKERSEEDLKVIEECKKYWSWCSVSNYYPKNPFLVRESKENFPELHTERVIETDKMCISCNDSLSVYSEQPFLSDECNLVEANASKNSEDNHQKNPLEHHPRLNGFQDSLNHSVAVFALSSEEGVIGEVLREVREFGGLDFKRPPFDPKIDLNDDQGDSHQALNRPHVCVNSGGKKSWPVHTSRAVNDGFEGRIKSSFSYPLNKTSIKQKSKLFSVTKPIAPSNKVMRMSNVEKQNPTTIEKADTSYLNFLSKENLKIEIDRLSAQAIETFNEIRKRDEEAETSRIEMRNQYRKYELEQRQIKLMETAEFIRSKLEKRKLSFH